jgi:hypothetical protein
MQQNNNTCTTRSVSQSVKEKAKAQITLAQNAITKTKNKAAKRPTQTNKQPKQKIHFLIEAKMDIEN